MAVEASIIVEFGDDVAAASANVIIEIDDEHQNNLDEEGEAKSFAPGDNPVFLIHHDTSVEITDVRCTNGSVFQIGINTIISRPRETDVLFTLISSDVSIPYSSGFDLNVEWFGNMASVDLSGQNVIARNGTFPCYGNAEFNVIFNRQYQLNPPLLDLQDDETYTIYVVVYMRSRQ